MLSLLIPISIVRLFCPYYYLRRRMIARMGGISNSMMGAGIFRSTYRPKKYYCMSCGTQHKQIACPKCVSKMKRIG